MPLSTNSVFHFTNNIGSIKGILSSFFRIKYCLETIEGKDKTISYAVPMVSFCDIPLSQVINHVDKYGGYGIGLFKKWAKRKKLNPVLYLEKNSTILNEVLIREKFENSNNQIVQEFLRFTKNYEGRLIRDGEVAQKEYRFYDEREWRHCPTVEDMYQQPIIIHNIENYKENKQQINDRISHLKLDFTLKDISYLIVKDNDEILEIISHLENTLRNEKDKSYIKILTSKIITSRQIRTDF